MGDDIVAFMLSLISRVIAIEKTTFFHILGLYVSLWDIDITFGVVSEVVCTLIPIMWGDEDRGLGYDHESNKYVRRF